MAKWSKVLGDENRRQWCNRFSNGHVPLPRTGQLSELSVLIRQCDGPAESTLFRMDSSRVGCCISIRCATDVRGGVPLEWVDVETPWSDVVFDSLPDPATLAVADQYYRFHDLQRREYERRFVINQKLPGVLHRGPGWEGFLLGIFYGKMPNKISRPLNLRVVLHDAFGRSAAGTAEVIVEPDPKPRVRRVPNYGGLLEKDISSVNVAERPGDQDDCSSDVGHERANGTGLSSAKPRLPQTPS
jgi:hypothetical protein